MEQKNIKGIVVGAILGTMLGSLSAALMPKNTARARGLARNLKDTLYNGSRNEMNPAAFVKGALSGLVVGASVAAFLTPKTGRQLRNNLSQRYQDLAEKTQDILHMINEESYAPPPSKRRKASAHATVRHKK